MHETLLYGLIVLGTSAAGLIAVQSHTLSQWLRVPGSSPVPCGRQG